MWLLQFSKHGSLEIFIGVYCGCPEGGVAHTPTGINSSSCSPGMAGSIFNLPPSLPFFFFACNRHFNWD